jgi:predicted Zn-dependent protease
MKKFILPLTIFFTVSLFSGCAVNPVTGKKQLAFISEAQEIAMGKEADPQIIAQYGLYENPELQKFINEKGREMAVISHRPNLTYNFRSCECFCSTRRLRLLYPWHYGSF